MEPLRTVMFIDGRNFKYNLQAFRFQSAEEKTKNSNWYYYLDEKNFFWKEFFLGIISKYNEATHYEHRLVRVYWYNAETIRPFEERDSLVQSVLDKYSGEFPDLDFEKVKFLALNWYNRERDFFFQTKQKVYENIQRKTDFLEFKYTGEYVVRPFEVYKIEQKQDKSFFYQGTREGEKGVDVGISVDMVAKMGNYDVAILISGDADFLPVVRYLKDNLKIVYQFSIAKGIPPSIQYLSPWLIGVVDVFQFYNELELIETYLNRTSSIPQAILDVIDKRITYLKRLH